MPSKGFLVTDIMKHWSKYICEIINLKEKEMFTVCTCKEEDVIFIPIRKKVFSALCSTRFSENRPPKPVQAHLFPVWCWYANYCLLDVCCGNVCQGYRQGQFDQEAKFSFCAFSWKEKKIMWSSLFSFKSSSHVSFSYKTTLNWKALKK